MSIQVVTEINLATQEHLRYYFVDIDGGKYFDYRGRTSMHYFRQRSLKKPIVNKISNSRYVVNWYDDHKIYEKSRVKYKEKDVPTTTCHSIWEFYKTIGYDYKSQKFRENPCPHSP